MDASEKYDAFISYSHRLDEQLAKRLQPELERFAKPWYRIRALHVFRDDVNLSAHPDLWGSIREALAASRWLILLASPEAGRSEWIDREVSWWLDNKPDPTNHLLIAVTDGRPPWDSAQEPHPNGAESIIPSALRAHLESEPRWVDLRGVRVPEPGDEYRTRFQDAIANLAAPLRGISKDLLNGESIRQHRRAMRLARQALIVLTALLIAAVLGGVYSYVQRNQALDQARLANSRQLVAEASALGASHPGLARQLLAEANRVDPTPQVKGALMNSLSLPGELDFSGRVSAEAYMPSEPVLAVGTDNGVSLVNTSTGRPLATVSSGTGHVSAVAFRPDGRIMATGAGDGNVRLWDVSQPSQPRLIETINAKVGPVEGLAFSRSGDILAAAYSDQVVALWNVQSPTQPGLFSAVPAEGPLGIAVAISPDGSVLAASGTGTAIQLWDITRPGHPKKLAALAGSAADALAFSPDGSLLASGSQGDFDVRIWDVTHPARPQARAILSGHAGPVGALAFSPDGRTLASGSEDDTAKLWDLADPLQPSEITTLSGHADFVTALAFSPDGQTLAGGSDDQSVFLWNMAGAGTTVPLATLSGSRGPAAFSPDNRYVVAGDPPELWDISTPGSPRAVSALVSPNDYAGSVLALDFSPDSHFVAVDNVPGNAVLWDLVSPEHPRAVATIKESSEYPTQDLAFSSDGHSLVTPGSTSPQIWSIRTPSRPVPLSAPRVPSPQGTEQSFNSRDISPADLITLWQALSPGDTSPLVNWISQNKNADVIGISPHTGMLITLAGSQQLNLWDVSDPARPAASLTSTVGDFQVAAISPDGSILAAASQTGANIWDISDRAHPAGLTTLNFSANAAVPFLKFSANGAYLATGGSDIPDQIWEMDIPGILDRLCAETGNTITTAQWNQYAPGIAYTRPCPPAHYLPGAGARYLPNTQAATPSATAPPVKVTVSALHKVDWQNTPMPGQFCSVPGLVSLHKGEGQATSTKWGHVQFILSSPVLYGDLQGAGSQDAAVPVWCTNSGGTADGQISLVYLIFALHDKLLQLIGTVAAQVQPPRGTHVSFIVSITMSPGSIVAHEDWYRASDATCCPTGKAVTVWSYTNGKLVPGTPDITS